MAYTPNLVKKPKPKKPIPRPTDPLAPWGPTLIQQEADARIEAILAPLRQEHEKARLRAKEQHDADLAGTQAAYLALAQAMGGGGASVGAIFGNAGASSGAIGENMRAAGEGRLAGAAGEASAEVLRNNPTADVSQIQQGYAPAAAMGAAHSIAIARPGEALKAEGAAKATDAALQPDFALLRGMDYIREQNAQYNEILRDLDDDLQEQMAKVPQLRLEIEDTMRDYELDKIATRGNLEALGLRAQGQAWDQAQDVARNKREQQRIANERRRIELAERRFKNDLAKAAASGTKPNVTLSKHMGWLVDDWGQPIKRNGKKVLVPKEVKPKSPETKTEDRNKALGERNKALNDAVNNAESFIQQAVKPNGTWALEYIDKRGKPKYSMIRARVMQRFWNEVKSYTTAAGAKALRAEFSKRIDQMLRANGVVPQPARRR